MASPDPALALNRRSILWVLTRELMLGKGGLYSQPSRKRVTRACHERLSGRNSRANSSINTYYRTLPGLLFTGNIYPARTRRGKSVVSIKTIPYMTRKTPYCSMPYREDCKAEKVVTSV